MKYSNRSLPSWRVRQEKMEGVQKLGVGVKELFSSCRDFCGNIRGC